MGSRRMKPPRSTSLMRQITVKTGSESVSGPDWQPELHQTPITQPEPEPGQTPTAQIAAKTQQGPNTQQEPVLQQRPLPQQEPVAQHEAGSQQEPRAQRKSALQQELLASQEPAPQQSPPIYRVSFTQQEAASQQGPVPGSESKTQQEPELRERYVTQWGPDPVEPPAAQQEAGSTPPAQPRPGPKNRPPAQTDSTSQERLKHSDPAAQKTSSAQEAKPQQGYLAERVFLSKLHDLYLEHPASDSDLESDLGSPLEAHSPAMTGRTVAPGMKLASKEKPGYEVVSEYGGPSAHGKNNSSPNQRPHRDTGEFKPGGTVTSQGQPFTQS